VKFSHHHGLEWSVSIPAEEVVVLAEKQSLKRVLLILVDNAIKYTLHAGKVRLSLHSTATEAMFEVVDSGIGIAPEDIAHIFQRFYRASNARDINPHGCNRGAQYPEVGISEVRKHGQES
jgi:signal transduction histidine kinase